MKKKKTAATRPENNADLNEEGPCAPTKLNDELRRSARKKRREERAQRREASGKKRKKKRSKTSSPHFDIRPEDTASSLGGQTLAEVEREGDARVNAGAKATIRTEDKPKEIGTRENNSPPSKKRGPAGTKKTKKPRTTSPHFETKPEAPPPEPRKAARKTRAQKSNRTAPHLDIKFQPNSDQATAVSKPKRTKTKAKRSETSGIKKNKKSKATCPHFDTLAKAPLETITENIPQETRDKSRAKKSKRSKSTSPHFEIKIENPLAARKISSRKSKSTSPHVDIKSEDTPGEILASQIDDLPKAIIDSAEQDQTSISKPRRTRSRAKVISYVEPEEEQESKEKKKKQRKRQSKEEMAVENQERKERKKTFRRVQAGISTAIWPPLSSDKFGLIQEELKGDAFHLIVGTTFLNRTRGSVAIPLLRKFLHDYPTPHALFLAPIPTISTFLQPLGLYNIRATRLHNLAKAWLTAPPTFGRATKKYNYPPRDTKPFPSSLFPNNGVEQGLCWEIAHLPGVGAYALDSWRIFCRDEFRRAAGQRVEVGQEEWRSVVPMDKELRVYVRWMWAKEGLKWKEPGDFQQTALSSPFFEKGVEVGENIGTCDEI